MRAPPPCYPRGILRTVVRLEAREPNGGGFHRKKDQHPQPATIEVPGKPYQESGVFEGVVGKGGGIAFSGLGGGTRSCTLFFFEIR